MKKIAIFQTGLQLGGIEKSLYNLMLSNIFESEEIDVYLFSRTVFYDITRLPSNVKIFYLDDFPFWYRFVPFNLIKHINIKGINTEKEYDVAIDFSGYSQSCASAVFQVNAKSKSIWIHNDIFEKYKEEIKYRILFSFFKKKYKYYDNYVAVSLGVADSLKKLIDIENKRVFCIPNLISSKEILEKSKEECSLIIDDNKYNLITSGRLCHQKGFDILLDTMEEVIKYRQDIKLYILGDGVLKDTIKKIVKIKGLEEFVELLGAVKNPYKYMNLMDGYVLMSRYEGQGIVLSEAKVLGLELFFPKRLEKYNVDMYGYENVAEALLGAKKKKKKFNEMTEYIDYVVRCYKDFIYYEADR